VTDRARVPRSGRIAFATALGVAVSLGLGATAFLASGLLYGRAVGIALPHPRGALHYGLLALFAGLMVLSAAVSLYLVSPWLARERAWRAAAAFAVVLSAFAPWFVLVARAWRLVAAWPVPALLAGVGLPALIALALAPILALLVPPARGPHPRPDAGEGAAGAP
jgi:hypothetical protein